MRLPTLGILQRRKYEILLIALVAHLFIGIFLRDLTFYARVIWPINMLILGLACVGIFQEKGYWRNMIKNILLLIVFALPLGLPFVTHVPFAMQVLSLLYVIFFAYIFFEIMRFLIRPGYINVDIISASACGYFLLIEISVFLLQFFFYRNPESFVNISTSSIAATYMDLVYFSSIIFTTIGFGDVTPTVYYTELIVSLLGIIGHFYTVVLVGIMISKFSSETDTGFHIPD
ncbi:ion channel [Fodinibius salsisoli]|uniref:Two pore domain potassium channel family protein n=1 Tax=Fodinibius salsisoli TaxID=2820877 RepID=A0ABT3PPF7_9BACT|nr:ion channel [Fodinibius salsisoli]MCW9707721.1 two pore domain potassium channel family protein [Fodinibius salsisoli]